MAERNTKVRLVAEVNGYVAGMERAQRATSKMSMDSTAKLSQQRDAFEGLGRSSMRVGLVVAAGIALAIARFAEFDAAMSNVQAATQETSENMDKLRAAALEAGASTVFTATEAANAIEELGKAGLSTQEILSGGLTGALALASAGQLGVARAAEVAAITMKQFGLAGKDIPHIADLLAAGAGKAAGDVEDLSQALNQSALVAHATGLSVEETTGALAAFASAGLLGSDAGTSFKTMLAALVPKSDEAGKLMESLGFSAYDAQGNFVGLAKLAGNLGDALKGMTVETQRSYLQTIFGQDAIRAATILYQEGADGIQEWIDKTNDSGYAAKVAADRLNNLQGDVEKLGGAFDTALIKTGSGANDTLRELVQTLTYLVDGFGDLPQPVLDSGLAVGTVVAAIALTGGAALTAIPRVIAIKSQLGALGLTAGRAAISVGLVGTAIGAYLYFMGEAIAAQADLAQTGDDLVASLDSQTGAFTKYSRELVAKKLQDSGAAEQAKKYGISLDTLTDAAFNNADAVENLRVSQEKYMSANPTAVFDTAVGDTDRTLQGLQETVRKAPGEFADLQKAAGTDAAGAFDEMTGSITAASDEMNEFAQSLKDFGNAALDVEKAQSQLEEAVDRASKSIKDNGNSLKIGSEEGRANRDALRGIVSAAKESAAAILENGGSADDAAAALERGREAVENLRKKMGQSKDAVSEYNYALSLTPEQIKTELKLRGVEAADEALRRLTSKWQGKQINLRTAVDGKLGSGILGNADGGAIRGVGGPRDDNILRRVSNGEHMFDAEDVKRMGGQEAVYAFRQSLYSGARPSGGSGSGSTTMVNITVPVTVKSMAVDNPDLLARTLTTAVTDAVRNGVVPQDWNSAG